jgi:hypothetical protein
MFRNSTIIGCGLTTLIGFTISRLVACWMATHGGLTKLRQSTKPSRILAHHLTSAKSPLWTWFLSITMSSLVYPTCLTLAYVATSSKMNWLQGSDGSSIHDDSNYGLRLFLYSFFGYIASDIPSNVGDNLFFAHHVCCLLGILCTLETTSSASVPAALGIFILEEGSLVFNVWSLDKALFKYPAFLPWWPRFESTAQKRSALNWTYYSLMTVSNSTSFVFLWRATTIAMNNGFYAFAFSGICFGTPMIIVRQMNVFMEKKPDVVELTKEQQQ